MSTIQVDHEQGAPPQDPFDRHTGGDGNGHDHGHDELPHLPPPSIRPLIMAAGLMFVAYGIVFVASFIGLGLLFLGLLIFGIGMGGWIYDDIQDARRRNASEAQH